MADGNSVLAQAVQVEIIGLNIKTCLDLKGKTYQWLSEQTLIPATVLHDYSEGEGRISPERIATIAKTLSLAQEVLIHDFSETDRVDVIRKAVHGEHYVLETDTLTAIGAKSAAGVIQPGDPLPDWWKKAEVAEFRYGHLLRTQISLVSTWTQMSCRHSLKVSDSVVFDKR